MVATKKEKDETVPSLLDVQSSADKETRQCQSDELNQSATSYPWIGVYNLA